jgi:hypothetical protein
LESLQINQPLGDEFASQITFPLAVMPTIGSILSLRGW